jgi:hypothetical protein
MFRKTAIVAKPDTDALGFSDADRLLLKPI